MGIHPWSRDVRTAARNCSYSTIARDLAGLSLGTPGLVSPRRTTRARIEPTSPNLTYQPRPRARRSLTSGTTGKIRRSHTHSR
jgi:hypothetical protein